MPISAMGRRHIKVFGDCFYI